MPFLSPLIMRDGLAGPWRLQGCLIRDGTLARLIAEDGVSGVTSNPSIFQNALASNPYYAQDLVRLRTSEPTAHDRTGHVLFLMVVIANTHAAHRV